MFRLVAALLALVVLSDGVPSDSVTFYYYPRTSKTPRQIVINDDNAIKEIPNLPLKVVIHGMLGSYTQSYMQEIKDGYINPQFPQDVNVFMVDWAPLADNNPELFPHTKFVADRVREFLSWFVNQGKVDWNGIHIVGFSMGGQIAGQIGHRVKKQDGNSLARVSSIDPALYVFPQQAEYDRVTNSSADFVDVMHTTAGTIGYGDPTGHVDFYVNGGRDQAGCENKGCSHTIAPRFYAESILGTKKFIAKKCHGYDAYKAGECRDNPTLEMGEHTNTSIPTSMYGTYYLETNANKPYAQS